MQFVGQDEAAARFLRAGATGGGFSKYFSVPDYRATLGKASLGFINPALFGNQEIRAALRDVVGGSSRGCGEDGFPATEGWDPATGLGSLDFAVVRKSFSKV